MRVWILAVATAGWLAACGGQERQDADPAQVDAPTAPLQPAATGAIAGDVVLLTNEPFFRARVEGGEVRLSGVDLEPHGLPVLSSVEEDGVRTIVAGDGDRQATLVLRDEPCQDSMAGAHFPWTGSLSIDGREMVPGCAHPASEPPPGEPGH